MIYLAQGSVASIPNPKMDIEPPLVQPGTCHSTHLQELSQGQASGGAEIE